MQKKTHEWFINEMITKRPDILVIGQYSGIDTKILCQCNICGYQWMVTPYNILHSRECPACAKLKRGKERITNEEFTSRMNNINPNIEILSEYTTSRGKINCRCKICEYEWFSSGNSLLMGKGCKKCAILYKAQEISITHDEFVHRLFNINDQIKIIGNYNGMHNKINCQCVKCNHKWKTNPNDLLKGHGCPKCNMSRGEISIDIYLHKHNINFVPQYKFDDCVNIKQLPFDFYLPDYNMCIEYDGKQHFEPIDIFGGQEEFEAQKQRDKMKTQYCLDNNINLLRIPYWDYDNISQILNTHIF